MSKLIGAILLVSGTTIGAAMLALPTVTGLGGFIPSAVLFIILWLFLLYTAFLMLEANLWFPGQANMISMARNTLGPIGEFIAWVAYLYLLYALMCAYMAGSQPIVLGLIKDLSGWEMPSWVGYLPFTGLFFYYVSKGAHATDSVNKFLMIALCLSFIAMIAFLIPHVELPKLEHQDWSYLPLSLSVAATSFGFHIIIPSLTRYLDRDVNKMKIALFVGSLIPLIVYLIWDGAALGIIPLDQIKEGYARGENGASLLANSLNLPVVAGLAQAFSFFAIVTSFLGVSLSLADCLADGLHMRKWGSPSWVVDLLTIVPPILIALSNPRVFLLALEYAGAYGVIVLLCILPALMVWRGRYIEKFTGPYRTPGGKGSLGFVIAISMFIIIFQIYG